MPLAETASRMADESTTTWLVYAGGCINSAIARIFRILLKGAEVLKEIVFGCEMHYRSTRRKM